MASQERLDVAYMKMAYNAAELSNAVRRKVGAILVTPNEGRFEGVNGTHDGASNVCEFLKIEERWLPTEYAYHMISTLGRVKRLIHTKVHKRISKLGKEYQQPIEYEERYLDTRVDQKGYSVVKIGQKYIKIHQLVARAFIRNDDYEKYNQINHIDYCKTNNNVLNLEWCTNIYNSCHRSKKDLPAGITCYPKGKFQYQVQYLKDNVKRSKRTVTLEEAIAIRSQWIDESDFVTYKYQPLICDLHTKPEVLHAESNAIMKVARSHASSVGGTLYCTLAPCLECAKLIIQAGIVRVVYSENYPYPGHTGVVRTVNLDILKEAGIVVDVLPMLGHNNDERELFPKDDGHHDPTHSQWTGFRP